MNVRKRHGHDAQGGRAASPIEGDTRKSPTRSNSRKRLANANAMIGYYATGSFVLVGIGLCLFLLFHRHHYDIETGREVDEEGTALVKGGAITVSACQMSNPPATDPPTPRYVTVVMPSVVNPKGRAARLNAIAGTWGCEGRAIYVVHDMSEYSVSEGVFVVGAGNGKDEAVASSQVVADNAGGVRGGIKNDVDTAPASSPSSPPPYPKLIVVPPNITVEEGAPRLEFVIRTVTDAIDPDFAFFVNDHTFVIPEHACAFLSGKDPSAPMYAGHAMRNRVEKFPFNSGAAGYFLSRATMAGLIDRWDAWDPICSLGQASKWHQGNPGLLTARCMSEVLHTNAIDTRDEHGWHRFHAFGIVRTVAGKVDKWYVNKHVGLEEMLGPDERHQHELGKGRECCSAETVSFHYVENAETIVLNRVRNALKADPSMTDQNLTHLMMSSWPNHFRDLGGYSHGLPKEKSKQFDALMAILRRISQPDVSAGC